MIEKGVVLPMFYLPPVEYFALIRTYSPEIIMEQHEHFPKQTFRNRANIYSPDGMLTLVVPVVKGSKVHTPVKDVKISYDFGWQRLHWMSLQACYRRSAYFEYYEDEFAVFYQARERYLFDLNSKMLELLMRLLGMPSAWRYSAQYEDHYSGMVDYRQSLHPKKASAYSPKSYFQLFSDRHGFIGNLSIVDLLFNQGPQATAHL